MKKLTVDEMKNIQLEILKSFVAYCENNKLDYFLAAGTAIGAVRHQGFIPWDDDIDVMMPRSSYDEFLKNYLNDQYEVFDCWRREDYYYPFAKLVDKSTLLKEKTSVPTAFGVYIDIFPMERVPAPGSRALIRQHWKVRFYRAMLSLKLGASKPKDVQKWGIRLLSGFVSVPWLHNRINRWLTRYDAVDTGYVGILTGYHALENKVVPQTIFQQVIRVPFEGHLLPVPVQYDVLLRTVFGEDYMQLPPEEQRVCKHQFDRPEE